MPASITKTDWLDKVIEEGYAAVKAVVFGLQNILCTACELGQGETVFLLCFPVAKKDE